MIGAFVIFQSKIFISNLTKLTQQKNCLITNLNKPDGIIKSHLYFFLLLWKKKDKTQFRENFKYHY